MVAVVFSPNVGTESSSARSKSGQSVAVAIATLIIAMSGENTTATMAT